MDVPCTWDPSGITKLTLGATGRHGRATSIAVSGGVVLVGGYIVDGSSEEPCYWLDGSLALLEGAAGWESGRVSAVAFSGSDIVCGGQYTAGGTSVPCTWKNGTLTTLAGGVGSSASTVTSVAASGGVVHSGGSFIDGTATPVMTRPCRWTGDTVSVLAGGAGWINGYVQGIAVDTAHVYTAGYYFDGASDAMACYWTDNVISILPAGAGGTSSRAVCVALRDGLPVLGGQYRVGGLWKPCAWTNGLPVDLEVDADCPGALVNGIAADATGIAAAGSCIDEQSRTMPSVWVDQATQDLPLPADAVMGEALAVAILSD